MRKILLFIIGASIGVIMTNYLLDDFNKPYNIDVIVTIDTLKVKGKTMYWAKDTLWNDENHIQFLKVYPKELLEGKTIIRK